VWSRLLSKTSGSFDVYKILDKITVILVIAACFFHRTPLYNLRQAANILLGINEVRATGMLAYSARIKLHFEMLHLDNNQQ